MTHPYYKGELAIDQRDMALADIRRLLMDQGIDGWNPDIMTVINIVTDYYRQIAQVPQRLGNSALQYFPQHGAFFNIVNGELNYAPSEINGDDCIGSIPLGECGCVATPDMDNYSVVTAPSSQALLDDINQYFRTQFTMDQFDGR